MKFHLLGYVKKIINERKLDIKQSSNQKFKVKVENFKT